MGFQPPSTVQGAYELIDLTARWLKQLTGMAAVAMSPAAGAHGELCGLMCIKAAHEANGQGHRKVVLVPESAHGTNPASAQMVGMKVVVTKCDANGNVDLDDLRAKCEAHSANLACVMITYPSTYGVYETRVTELCKLVHEQIGRAHV